MNLELYTAALDPDANEIARLSLLLSEEERQRAERFRFDRDRRRFLVRRAKLRQILGARAGIRPELLRFETGAHGKPSLKGGACPFSASHSDELMLVAIGDQEVGCDVERIVPDFDWQPLAERFFTTNERQALLFASDGLDAFFRCWTRKEAFVKGLSLGLSYPLNAFQVSVGKTANFLSGGRGWSLMGDTIGADYVFAIAVRERISSCSIERVLIHI